MNIEGRVSYNHTLVLLYTSGHRNYMKSEGRLSYNNTIHTLLGIGLLWNMGEVSALIILLVYFWAHTFYVKRWTP